MLEVGFGESCAIIGGDIRCLGPTAGSGGPKKKAGLPPRATLLSNTSAICAAFASTDDIYCWGHSVRFRLAAGGFDDPSFGLSEKPQRLRSFHADAGLHGHANVMASSQTLLGLTAIATDNEVEQWLPLAMDHDPVPLAGVTSLSLSDEDVCAVANGRVSCWPERGIEPEPLYSASKGMPPALDGHATMVASGSKHHCVLAAGDVYCWGSRAYPSIGDNEPLCVPASCWSSDLPYDPSVFADGGSCLEPLDPRSCDQEIPKLVELPAD